MDGSGQGAFAETPAAMFGGVYAGKRVFVTGHTGFKGAWLTAWLLGLGAEVCGYSDRVPTQPSLFELAGLEPRIRHVVGDVRDQARVAEAIESFQPDVLFHLAAQAIVSTSYADPVGTIAVNAVGTACVMDALRRLKQPCAAVIITSDKAYENVEWPWGYRETDRLGGRDVYSGSKGAAELVFHAFHHSFFLRTDGAVRIASARAGNVIGGGDWAADRIVADCIRAWQAGRPVEIRSPRATRPWQHVLEPLSGYLTLGAELSRSADRHGESYNFGPRAEQNASVLELLTDLAGVWGMPADQAFRVTGDIPFHEAGLLKLNCDKALLELRWRPTLDYGECVRLTGGWYREVLREGADAQALTAAHIATYQDIAMRERQAWTGEAKGALAPQAAEMVGA